MFHWNDQRIREHVGLCFLSFLLLRTIEIKHRKHMCDFSPQKLRDTINSLEFSQIKIGAADYSLTAPLSADASSLLKTLEINPPEAFGTLESFQKLLSRSIISINN